MPRNLFIPLGCFASAAVSGVLMWLLGHFHLLVCFDVEASTTRTILHDVVPREEIPHVIEWTDIGNNEERRKSVALAEDILRHSASKQLTRASCLDVILFGFLSLYGLVPGSGPGSIILDKSASETRRGFRIFQLLNNNFLNSVN